MAKPKVFVNVINKDIKNNKESYYFRGDVGDNEITVDELEMIDDSISLGNKLNNIFDSDSFVYKSRVIIELKDGTKLNEEIIAVKSLELITLSDKKIKISDIKDIKKAN